MTDIKLTGAEKLGANICIFVDHGRKNAVALEYDYNIGGFREKSDYMVTKTYRYNGRSYDRTRPANMRRYYNLLACIPEDTYKKAYELF